MQQDQSPQSPSQNLARDELAAVRRVRSRRFHGLLAGAGATALSLFVAGCPEPADLDNPSMYPPGTNTGGSGGSSGGGGGDACEEGCITTLFAHQTKCQLCHSPRFATLAGLNLEPPGFTARMKGVVAQHNDFTDPTYVPTACLTGDKLIDVDNPNESWLLKKVDGRHVGCGDPMPQAGNLTAEELQCVRDYVSCVAGKPLSPGGGGGTGGTSGGATAGTGGGGGSGGS